MRTRTEIEGEIRRLIIAAWEKCVSDHSERLPRLCVHNHRQVLDFDETREGEPNPGYNRLDRLHLPVVRDVGICMYGASSPKEWPGTICDEPLDAKRCPVFTLLPQHTTAALWEEFSHNLQNPLWLGENLPQVAALLWALEDSSPWIFRIPGWVSTLLRVLFKVKAAPQMVPTAELPEFTPDGLVR